MCSVFFAVYSVFFTVHSDRQETVDAEKNIQKPKKKNSKLLNLGVLQKKVKVKLSQVRLDEP